jgi:hypothetical protein
MARPLRSKLRLRAMMVDAVIGSAWIADTAAADMVSSGGASVSST